MASTADFRRIALALEGTTEVAHFDRAAFRVARIYATLAADGATANLKFTADEQALKCVTAPEAFMPVSNAWGLQGWTTLKLPQVDEAQLRLALETAWRHALPLRQKSPTRRGSKIPNPKRRPIR